MITVNNVTFGYNRYHAVLKDFSLDFQGGGIYGLLGKNGTGKSTLLYLIMGLLRPEKGLVEVDGMEASRRLPEMLSEVFLVPEEYDMPRITLREYVRALKPFYTRFSEELLAKCLDGFDMSPEVHLGGLSLGQKKKVYMCLALATNTRYLLMDEPTNGLDILSKSQFRRVLLEGMTDEKTVLISTHQVHDVERLLDHVTIIDRNRVLLQQQLVEESEP
ncbi:MAG: ABC transporter ATP-binding protein, partial [Desulfovibrionaceae bacterium]|nr:ABC transporter ATP-binding protein [Desulfovibrionaceae bacterium]